MIQPAQIVIIPLIGRQQNEEAHWIGALLSRLWAAHLEAAGLPVMPYNVTVDHLKSSRFSLPLKKKDIETLTLTLKLRALIHGQYVLDEEAKLLGVRLMVEGADIPPAPLEVATPLAGFSRFVERIALSLVERLGESVDDDLRASLHDVRRPASFEALRQLARAYAAWSRKQNELALTAVDAALALDPAFEEAIGIKVAIARTADDISAARDAFRRWVEVARRDGRPLDAGNRLLMMGHWLAGRGEWSAARSAYEDARALFEGETYDRGKSQALNNLSNLDLVRGRTQDAIQVYRRSLRVFEAEPDGGLDMAITYYNLGLAHKNLGQREEAKRAVEQARALARRLNDAHLEAMCFAQRGALHDDAGEWAQARVAYDQAARLFDLTGDDSGRAIVKSHQAMLHKQQGAYSQAEQLMLEALDLFDESGDPHAGAVLLLNMADLYLAMQLYDQSWEYARRAHDVFVSLKSDWQNITKELLETLDSIPELPEEDDLSLPDLTDAQQSGSAPSTRQPRSPAPGSSPPQRSTPLSSGPPKTSPLFGPDLFGPAAPIDDSDEPDEI